MIIFIGTFIFVIGIWCRSYYLLIAGRVIFGIGGENMITAQMVCTEKWFGGKFLSVAIGMNLVFAYIGTLLNNFFTPFMVSLLDSIFNSAVCIMFI